MDITHIGKVEGSLNKFLKAPDRNISDPTLLTHNYTSAHHETPSSYPKALYAQLPLNPKSVTNFKDIYQRPFEPSHFYERHKEEFPEYTVEYDSKKKKSVFGPPSKFEKREPYALQLKQLYGKDKTKKASNGPVTDKHTLKQVATRDLVNR